jgi:hypothetical protein
MSSIDKVAYSIITFCVLMVVIGMPVITLLQASQESKRFNRLTGASTTMWDAVFLELRVELPPKSQPNENDQRVVP